MPYLENIRCEGKPSKSKRDHFGARLSSGLKYMGPFSIDYREQGSHARGVYITQYTSRMGTARVEGEVGADTSVIAIE